MSKRKHHFVPKLYLRAFSSSPKRINLVNLKLTKSVQNASLRNQCYRHKLYGITDEVEDVLSVYESQSAPILRKIVEESYLPPIRSHEDSVLKFFVSLQTRRTPLIADRLDTLFKKLQSQISSYSEVEEASLDDDSFTLEDSLLSSLSNASDTSDAISDLKLHLIHATGKQALITSDNPTFKYNQYYEGLRGMGITGPLFRGIEIFLPLSPKRLLLLYDSTVYKVGNKQSNVSLSVTDEDIDALNSMQIVGADQNVYFSDWSKEKQIRQLSQKASTHRLDDPTIVEEFVQVGNEEGGALIHAFEQTPNLGINLSFVRLRKRAQRIAATKHKNGRYRYRKRFPKQTNYSTSKVPREVRTEIYKRKS